MAFRLIRYAVADMQRHLEAGHKKLPLVIPVLFYTGNRCCSLGQTVASTPVASQQSDVCHLQRYYGHPASAGDNALGAQLLLRVSDSCHHLPVAAEAPE